MSALQETDPETIDWLTLDEDEEIIWTGKPHKSSLVPALVIGVPLSFVLVGIPIIASAYLHRENTRYVVTTDALYKKSGVLSRDVQRIDFGKVQNTSYSQGFFGSQFGYGTVDISTAGGSGVEMQFQSVPEPRQVQERINKRVKAGRADSAREGGETKEDVLEDILGELRSIREILETEESTGTSPQSGAETTATDADNADSTAEDADTSDRTTDPDADPESGPK